jgi:hypothetical protein
MATENTCAKCRYVDTSAKRAACRRYPPQTHFIVVLRPTANQVMVAAKPAMQPVEEQRSAFPAVMPDWTCGEWAPRIETIS